MYVEVTDKEVAPAIPAKVEKTFDISDLTASEFVYIVACLGRVNSGGHFPLYSQLSDAIYEAGLTHEFTLQYRAVSFAQADRI